MSSPSNNTNVTLVTIYPAEIVLTGLYCLTLGLFGIATNILTVTAIAKGKKLHTPCFVILAAHSVSNDLMAVGYVIDGTQRLGVFFNLFGVGFSRLLCYLLYIPKTLGIPPSAIFACIIGLDRLYGIASPREYQMHAKRFVFLGLGFGAFVAVSNVLIAGLTAPSPITGQIMCYNFFAAFHPAFTKFYTNYNLALCLLSVCIYGSIIILVKCRQLKADRHTSASKKSQAVAQKTEQLLRAQLSILPMIQGIMIAYVLCGVCPEILASISSVIYNGMYQPKVILYASMLKATSVGTDFAILTLKSRDFKSTLKRILHLKSSTISAMNTVTVAVVGKPKLIRESDGKTNVTCFNGFLKPAGQTRG